MTNILGVLEPGAAPFNRNAKKSKMSPDIVSTYTASSKDLTTPLNNNLAYIALQKYSLMGDFSPHLHMIVPRAIK